MILSGLNFILSLCLLYNCISLRGLQSLRCLGGVKLHETTIEGSQEEEEEEEEDDWLVGFLTSSSTTRLYRRRALKQGV